MYLDNDRRRPSLTPQLAVRVAIIGGIALAAFAVVFFRLWYLQVLSGDKYETEANGNVVRKIKVQAPRGEIVDREGRVLVDNRTGLAVRVTPDKLPEDDGERREVYDRLGRVLGRDSERIERSVDDQLKVLPFSPATVKQDVPQKLVFYLFENQEDFPGVTVEQVFLREYPHSQVGAHLFGTVGEITKEQRDDPRYRGVALGDRVGQSGIESQYDRFLRGRNGAKPRCRSTRWATCAASCATCVPSRGASCGCRWTSTCSAAGQRALGGAKGAFAVMNVNNGEVLALGSSPVVRPQRVRQDHPQARPRPPLLQGQRRADPQPRDPGRLSHGLDLQAHHRHGGAPGRPDHARHRGGRRRLDAGRRRGVQERRRRGERRRWRCAGRCRCPATCSSTASARRPTARATGC